MITENIPLREYPTIVYSGFFDSDKSMEQLKQEIIDNGEKHGRHVDVSLSLADNKSKGDDCGN